MRKNSNAQYAIVWFEDDSLFTLVETETDATVLLTEDESQSEAASILRTANEIEEAEPGVRYAVPVHLLDELFGWVVDQ